LTFDVVYDVDIPVAVRLTFVFVGLGSQLEHFCTVSLTFDREGYIYILVFITIFFGLEVSLLCVLFFDVFLKYEIKKIISLLWCNLQTE